MIRDALISREFAQRAAVGGRLRVMWGHEVGLVAEEGAERAHTIDQPYLTVGRERYDRVAAAVAIEPRDPFLDLRVLAFCIRLPGEQTLNSGWPKTILRRATAGRLPDDVRWRRGKDHLGQAFTRTLLGQHEQLTADEVEAALDSLSGYVDDDTRRRIRCCLLERKDLPFAEDAYNALHLGRWLRRHATRPH
jgi:asparagine synthase (glutamine-hydrolysing)